MKIYSIAFLFVIGAFSSGSCDRNTPSSVGVRAEKVKVKKLTSLELPAKNAKFVIGEIIDVKLKKPDALELDSAHLFFRGQKLLVNSNTTSFTVPTQGHNPGTAVVRVKVFYNDSLHESDSQQIELLSDIVPKTYKYSIVNTFDHDIGAYTQGLQYYDGFLFEGTGNYNQSGLRKVNLQSGEILQVRSNASDIFGEGITIFQERIYQLTYKKQVCFVYDLNTFEEIQRHHFQNKEGWGLTNNGEELIMSDGTHTIYFIDPAMFTVIRQIEVYNNEGPVTSLNELEYINGKIYANRYYTDEIVIIDPHSGKEEGRVNMKGILSIKDRKPSTNVLNGIAWDDEGKRLFVTGKYWPKLFEIELK